MGAQGVRMRMAAPQPYVFHTSGCGVPRGVWLGCRGEESEGCRRHTILRQRRLHKTAVDASPSLPICPRCMLFPTLLLPARLTRPGRANICAHRSLGTLTRSRNRESP